MARQNHGPLSRAKGKLGGVVYQQYEGMQISREYQPVVKNPQTTKQTENRAKFKLSSQIVAQFKEVFGARLANLSIYERTRRGASINAIYSVVTTTDPETPEALLSSVVAAINNKSMSSFAGPTITDNSQGKFSVSATTDDVCIAVICGYDSDGKLVAREFGKWISTGDPKLLDQTGADSDVIMVVATRALTEAGRAAITNAIMTASSWSNYISRAIAAGDVEISNITSMFVQHSA